MPGNYSVQMNRAAASVALGLGTITADAGAPRRFGIYDIITGSDANPPQDFAFQYQMQRCTTTGTGTAVTPQALDPADAAAIFAALQELTVDPTLTANAIVINEPLNQRSSFRWVAKPGGELIAPATANNGFALRTPVAGALVALAATIHVQQF